MKIAQLAHQLNEHHAQSRSWQKTAEAFAMDKSTAYRIAMDNYDPADPAWRKAHGLGPRVCPTCQRKTTTPRVRRYKNISDMPSNVLLRALENRVVMQ